MSNNDIPTPKTTEHVTIFATKWCPFCIKLISSLKLKGVPFEAWDVEKHEELGEWVKSVNDGNRVVPTVLFSDGTYATNPGSDEVEFRYRELARD